MNQDQNEFSFDDSVKQVIRALPPVLRDYLEQGRYTPITKILAIKYGLRVDQVSILKREIMLLLMGIDNPDEFTQALVGEAELDQHAVSGITHDVNEQIFVPLRDQMRSGVENSGKPTRSQAQVSSQPKPSTPAPSYPTPRPQAFTVTPRTSEIPQPTVIIPANPSMPMRPQQQDYITKVPKYTPPHPSAPRPPAAVMPPRFATPAQKPMDTSRMLEDHEEPRMEFKQSVSRIIPPPPNLPGMMYSPPRSISPEPPPPVPLMPRPSLDSYSSDPYRESVDGE